MRMSAGYSRPAPRYSLAEGDCLSSVILVNPPRRIVPRKLCAKPPKFLALSGFLKFCAASLPAGHAQFFALLLGSMLAGLMLRYDVFSLLFTAAI
jgi:hypothetical protein